ncbi:MAG: hypothetical protein JWM87_1251 [Candidatus Eremiobacteraeota bacterium]|nr:hypothetical protein [Candidatus Eremiobacteraeota bacterium]
MFHPLLFDRSFWGDDPISRFVGYYWLPILAVLVVILIVSRRKKR